ncbi:MAG: hypothetical protein AAFO79_05980, partial [Pseudomonadota bacterium]
CSVRKGLSAEDKTHMTDAHGPDAAWVRQRPGSMVEVNGRVRDQATLARGAAATGQQMRWRSC